MEIITSLAHFPKFIDPFVLTIGNFDGVHLGHQMVLDRLKSAAKQYNALSAILTFSNHPSSVLSPGSYTPQIYTTEHKLNLLKKESDLLIIIPFTKELSNLSAQAFLEHIKNLLPFKALILGNDATIGKNKEGNKQSVEAISKILNFEVEYLPDFALNQQRISSSKVRDAIRQGNFVDVRRMLGRPFSIYAPISKGAGKGSQIGFPTANISVSGLCIPPLGVYAITLKNEDEQYYGVANLGMAPTLRSDHKTIFEVHIFNYASNLYGKHVEVIFNQYIRSEQRFENVIQLKEQIQKDVQTAKLIHGLPS